ncbi:DUF4232 domain-containing protein [Amycolatopsis benzoatilytica]|uniref:DUF4232 domain-containing protein n=1 Tax=Amycolatopsis benzoatilytica TaxID=346045 RepID=UPI00037A8FCF|nr:DUF4232 domain-containing protein [Amycolatopsis benzoatilytica]
MANTKKPWFSLVFLSAAGASGALLLSACGQGSPGASGTPTDGPASSPAMSASSAPASSSSAPSGSASSTAPAQKPPADNGLCKAGDVTLSLGKGDAGAGSAYLPLLIKNTSSQPCTIQGFPGVSYVGGDNGQQIGQPATRDGDKLGPVKLAPGQSAKADLQVANVRNYDAAACQPTPAKGFRVYLPQDTASKFVPFDGLGCAAKTLPGNGKQLGVKSVVRA